MPVSVTDARHRAVNVTVPQELTDVPVTNVVVGRQPIVDRDGETVGYELLYRPVASATAAYPSAELNGDQMTVDVLFGALGIGVRRLTGGKLAFCNADRGVLTQQIPVGLPPAQTVIEVLETVEIDDEVLDGCRALRELGFRLAADDFTWFDGAERLLELVSIVKIDLRLTPPEELPDLVARCRAFDVQLLAEKVEDDAELARCRELGFDLFQGYGIARPANMTGRTLDASQRGLVRLAGSLLSDDLDFADIEEVLRTEPALAYQLLQLAAIGRLGETKRPVHTIRDALVLMGLQRVRTWVAALMLRRGSRAPEANLATALGRARMVELLAGRLGPQLSGFGFTAGMISAFDVLLGVPPSELAETLDLPPDLHDAAFGADNVIGRVVRDVVDYEEQRLHLPGRSGFDDADLDLAAARAFEWALAASDLLAA